MNTARKLQEDVEECFAARRERSDWDPFVVWQQQISGTGPGAERRLSGGSDDWRPFRVWADHVAGGGETS